MIQRAATIVIKDGKILLMHRQKPGRDYYAIPGGHIENGESPEVAAIRELKEETSIDAEIESLFLESIDCEWHNYFYMVKNIEGQACLGGEELERNNKKNHYQLEWVELSKMPDINLQSDEVKKKIIKTLI